MFWNKLHLYLLNVEANPVPQICVFIFELLLRHSVFLHYVIFQGPQMNQICEPFNKHLFDTD